MGQVEEHIVRDFLRCAEGKEQSVDGLTSRMTDDVVWQVNVPLSKVINGRNAAREELERQNAMSTGSLPGSKITAIASNDHIVFTERVEQFEMAGKAVTLRVNAVFEVREGRIAAWREYFDSHDLATQLGVDANLLYR